MERPDNFTIDEWKSWNAKSENEKKLEKLRTIILGDEDDKVE